MTFTAHKYWDERILEAFASDRNIYSANAIGGQSETGVAVVKLVNTDGELDSWLSLYSFSDQDAVLWMGTDEAGVTFADLQANPHLQRNYLAKLTAIVKATGATTTIRLSSQGYSPAVTEAPSGYGEVFRGVVSDDPKPGLEIASLVLKDKQGKLDIAPIRPKYVGGNAGVRFSGSNGRATVISSAELDLTGDMVCMMRIFPDALSSDSLVGWRAGTRHPFHLTLVSDGRLQFQYHYGGGTFGSANSTITHSAGALQTVGFRISGDQLVFFSMDLDDPSGTIQWSSTPITLLASTRDAQVGAQFYVGYTSASFNGQWSEIRIWDGSGGTDYKRLIEQRIIPNDIAADDSFGAGLGDLVGYFKADETTGLTIADATASANDLTLGGGAAWDFPLKGNADLSGVEMPLVFGKFLHVEPVLVDSTKLIYQLNARSMASVTEVLQNGGTVNLDATFGTSGDATSMANFLADAVVNGEYGTYLAGGMIKLGSSGTGGLRVSGTGDNVGGYVSTAADIIERIATDFGPLSASDINSTNFTAFNSTTGSAVNGLSIAAGDPMHISTWIDFLLLGAAGFWYFDRTTGELELYEFTDPKTDVSTPKVIDDIAKGGIEPLDLKPPSWRQRLGYARTWDPIKAETLIGTAADSRVLELSQPYRIVQIAEPSIRSIHAGAEDPPVLGTSLAERDAAYNATVKRQGLYGADNRRRFGISMITTPDTFEVGDLVNIIHAPDEGDPRYSWETGELMRAVRVDEGGVKIGIWG